MDALFPPIEPYATHRVPVDGLHTLYVEECGNPQGAPVVFLHGGPGGGISPLHRRFFDPAAYRIVLFDQRGAGKSTPYAEMQANSPAHLVADIEHLRMHLGIERWHVFGGSWGSTLALAYAISHADRILSLILRGIFMIRTSELQWFYHDNRHMRPDAWETLAEILSPAQRTSGKAVIEAYLDMLENPNPAIHMDAARRWVDYETVCSNLLPKAPSGEDLKLHDEDDSPLAMARTEAHFFARHLFTPDDWILQSVNRFRHIPGVIVQGQYDLVCPPVSAWELHRAWPESKLVMVPDGGHSALEPGISRALVAATEQMKGMR